MSKAKKRKTKNVIEEEEIQEVNPQVYFGTASPFLQSVVLCHIFENHLSLFEQIEMRRVCRLWHYNVKHIWTKTRSLVLTVKKVSMKPSLALDLHKPKPNNEGNQFYSLQMAKGFELTIGKDHWNRATIDLLGDLFRNIEHLTIFYELSGWYYKSGNLSYILQKFPKVKSFSLVMPPTSRGGNASNNFLSLLFKTINDHLAPLHTLHLYLPNFATPYSAVDIKHFNKTLPYLQNFSFNSTVENLSEILQSMGKSLPARWPIQSLSFNVGFDKLLSPVENLFMRNSTLSHLKRLELTAVSSGSLDIVSQLLNHFTKLECLNLCKCPYARETTKFTFDWIETLSKLAHLQELYLWNFEIQIFNDWSNRPLAKSLPNIQKLTIELDLYGIVADQYYKINNVSLTQDVELKSMYRLFLHNFAKQFPKLEHLTIGPFSVESAANFSGLCITELNHLKSLRLVGVNGDSIYSSS